jgi:FkbM family methyltransferase
MRSRWLDQLHTDLALRRIKQRRRYEPFETQLLGHPLQVVDSLSFYYSFKEIFERQIYSFVSNAETPRIIDGGANIGLSILFFKQLYPHASIIGFEPDPRVFRTLQRNVATFQLMDVELVNAALWSTNTTLDFKAEGADAGTIVNAEGKASVAATAVRLRDYLRNPVDMLKLDIEGAEVEVLQDCGDRLEGVQNLFVEYHSFVNQPQRLDELLTVLRRAGLRVQIHTQFSSPRPLRDRPVQLGMDLRLNVFGYREAQYAARECRFQ